MRLRNQSVAWAAFLLLAGLFLLLKNLNVLDPWGDAIWGGLFAVSGLGFLIWFVLDVRQWWRAIPGFILLSIGALILLDWRKVALGDWRASIVLFGIALGFWAVLLTHRENWWAAIPAGALTVVGVLDSLTLNPTVWLAAFLGGLGLVFALVYFLHARETRWAAIPASGLILVSITTIEGLSGSYHVAFRFWPILLVAAGIGLLVGALQSPAAAPPPKPAMAAPKKKWGPPPPLLAPNGQPVPEAGRSTAPGPLGRPAPVAPAAPPASLPSTAGPATVASSPGDSGYVPPDDGSPVTSSSEGGSPDDVAGIDAPASSEAAESPAPPAGQTEDIYEFIRRQPTEPADQNTEPDQPEK